MDWKLKSQALEVRYANGLKYLDIAGEIATSLCEEYPLLKVKSFNSNGIILSDDGASITLEYNHERACVVSGGWEGTTDIKKYARVFFQRVLDQIGIRSLTRVGNLNSYFLSFADRSKAKRHLQKIAAVMGLKEGIMNPSEDERLKSKLLTSFTLRYDDETTAIALAAAVEEEEVKITGPYARHLRKHAPPKSDRVTINVDMFTTAPLAVENFVVDALLDSNDKMVKTRILSALLYP